jgi:hypothetical protein
VAIAALALGAGAARAQEREALPLGQAMGMSELPPQVRDTIDREARGRAVIGPISKRTVDGRTVYEAKLFHMSGHTQLDVAPDGRAISNKSVP